MNNSLKKYNIYGNVCVCVWAGVSKCLAYKRDHCHQYYYHYHYLYHTIILVRNAGLRAGVGVRVSE